MRLHEYMLPEVVDDRPSFEALRRAGLPSRLFVAVDPVRSQALVEEGTFSTSAGSVLYDTISSGYKHWRREYAFDKPFSNSSIPYFVDFEDARLIPRRATFGSDYNVFQYNRRKGDRTSVLWSLPNYFEPTRGVGHPPRGTSRDEIPFDDKIPVAFWRGGVSGMHWAGPRKPNPVPKISGSNIADPHIHARYSRIGLVQRFAGSKRIDAKFAGNTIERFVEDAASIGEFISSHMHANEMMKYKYLICPKGNDVSSSLYWVLRSNSLALKEEVDYETIPDFFLEPWVHYVPISPGLHDLEEKVEFCEQNSDLCRKIIDNAQLAYQDITNKDAWNEAKYSVLERLGMLK